MEATKKTSKWIVEEYRKGNMLDYDGNPIENDEHIPDVQIIDWYNWGEIYHKSEQMR